MIASSTAFKPLPTRLSVINKATAGTGRTNHMAQIRPRTIAKCPPHNNKVDKALASRVYEGLSGW